MVNRQAAAPHARDRTPSSDTVQYRSDRGDRSSDCGGRARPHLMLARSGSHELSPKIVSSLSTLPPPPSPLPPPPSPLPPFDWDGGCDGGACGEASAADASGSEPTNTKPCCRKRCMSCPRACFRLWCLPLSSPAALLRLLTAAAPRPLLLTAVASAEPCKLVDATSAAAASGSLSRTPVAVAMSLSPAMSWLVVGAEALSERLHRAVMACRGPRHRLQLANEKKRALHQSCRWLLLRFRSPKQRCSLQHRWARNSALPAHGPLAPLGNPWHAARQACLNVTPATHTGAAISGHSSQSHAPAADPTRDDRFAATPLENAPRNSSTKASPRPMESIILCFAYRLVRKDRRKSPSAAIP